MTDSGLLQAIDYILNKSDASAIEVLAEAVVKRRREMSIFGAAGNTADPRKMAEEITGKINAGIQNGVDGMRKSIREMIARIVKEHAPELSESRIDEICAAWMPETENADKGHLPAGVLLSMIEQFLSFSRGEMRKPEDEDLRKEMGQWPKRYWNSFPPVIRSLISDLLKDKITEKEFRSKAALALGV